MRPLVVVSSSPFQITSRRDRPILASAVTSERAAASTIHRLPVVFLGGDTPGKAQHTNSHSDHGGIAEPVEAEVSINLTQPAGAEKTADKAPGLQQQQKPEERAVDPVFGPPGTAAKPRTSMQQDF